MFCIKQKTAYEMRISDWSSDVCSSDLVVLVSRIQVAIESMATAAADGQKTQENDDQGAHGFLRMPLYRPSWKKLQAARQPDAKSSGRRAMTTTGEHSSLGASQTKEQLNDSA